MTAVNVNALNVSVNQLTHYGMPAARKTKIIAKYTNVPTATRNNANCSLHALYVNTITLNITEINTAHRALRV